MNVGNRIKARRKELCMSAETLALKVGCSPATIYRYENGEIKNTPVDKIQLIAEALQIDPTVLTGWPEKGEDVSVLPENILPVSRRKVPLLGTIAAGQPIYADEEYDAYVVDGAASACDFALRVSGDSMEPRFLDGDIVFFRSQDDVVDGQIAAVIIDDTAALKHVYHMKNGVQLVSDNPKYPPMIFDSSNSSTVRILGLAVGYYRNLD